MDDNLKSWFICEGNMSWVDVASLANFEAKSGEYANILELVEHKESILELVKQYSGGQRVHKVCFGRLNFIFDDERNTRMIQDTQNWRNWRG